MRIVLACSIWMVLAAAAAKAGTSEPTLPHNASGPYNTEPVVIHAGRLLAIPGEAPSSGSSIVVIEGVISAILPGFLAPEEAGVPGAGVVDLRDSFVLPGLIDCHVHITTTAGKGYVLRRVTMSDADRAIWGAYNARVTLEQGFTTVRDTAAFRGDSFEAIFALRDGIRVGKVPGPRILAAGQGIGATGTHADFNGFRHEILELFRSRAMCSGPFECREAVRYQVKRGADFIKMASTGGFSVRSQGRTTVLMFDDELEAIVDTAHRMGRKVTAHATSAAGINAALRAGVDSIEHGQGLDEESIRLFKETGAYLVPTLLLAEGFDLGVEHDPYRSGDLEARVRKLGKGLKDAAKRAHRAGVKIAFGTDSASIVLHGNNAGEFSLLTEIGMTPMEAIRAATVNAADNLGISEVAGSVEVGKAADIVAVSASPLQDIEALRQVHFVMRNGVVYKNGGSATAD